MQVPIGHDLMEARHQAISSKAGCGRRVEDALMAALKKSLAQEAPNKKAAPQTSTPAKPKRAAAAQAAKPGRKRA